MHKPVKKSLTLDEICEWIPKIKARNPKLPARLLVHHRLGRRVARDVAIHENIHEVVMATERARRYGFDYIALKPVLARGAGGAEVMDPQAAEDIDARSRADPRRGRQGEDARDRRVQGAREHEPPRARRGSWREFTHQPRVCHMQALRQVLTPMGTFNCPAHRGVEKARIGGTDAYADAAMAQAHRPAARRPDGPLRREPRVPRGHLPVQRRELGGSRR
jgi:hypothetical protein